MGQGRWPSNSAEARHQVLYNQTQNNCDKDFLYYHRICAYFVSALWTISNWRNCVMRRRGLHMPNSWRKNSVIVDKIAWLKFWRYRSLLVLLTHFWRRLTLPRYLRRYCWVPADLDLSLNSSFINFLDALSVGTALMTLVPAGCLTSDWLS